MKNEIVPSPEEINDLLSRLIPAMEKHLNKQYPSGTTRRFFHPKMHGLLKGRMEISEDLPEKLKQGMFRHAGSYPALIRMSSASPKIKDDRKKGFIGFAIKLYEVPGEKIHTDENKAQDFLLVSKQTLEASSLRMIVRAVEAIAGNIFVKIGFAVRYLPDLLSSLRSSARVEDIAITTFWSQTPYHFGNHLVKYRISPLTRRPEGGCDKDPDRLRKRLQARLTQDDLTFVMEVQFRENDSMPVEDPSKAWNSAFHKVAEIIIPKQQFDTEANCTLGEDLSFNPWHCLKDHEPAGAINRARKATYEIMSAFRKKRNAVKDRKTQVVID